MAQRTRSKRFTALKSMTDKTRIYSIGEAVALLKNMATTKFDQTVEIHLRTSIDPKKSDQQMRSTFVLPHGSGKKVKIAVIVADDKVKEAKESGADIVGGSELIEEIEKTKKSDFDLLLTTPDMMPKLAKLAKILGPKGMMPNPKNETVTPNIKKAVEELRKGKVTYKSDDTGNIHFIIGKLSYDDTKLVDNFTAAMSAITKAKPASIKGVFIKSAYITASMSPSVKVSA